VTLKGSEVQAIHTVVGGGSSIAFRSKEAPSEVALWNSSRMITRLGKPIGLIREISAILRISSMPFSLAALIS
jgi:hypothetical protein